jgi:hypothetical protein
MQLEQIKKGLEWIKYELNKFLELLLYKKKMFSVLNFITHCSPGRRPQF